MKFDEDNKQLKLTVGKNKTEIEQKSKDIEHLKN